MAKRWQALSTLMLGLMSLTACGTSQPRQAGALPGQVGAYDPTGGYGGGGAYPTTGTGGYNGYDTGYGPINNLPTGTVSGRITDSLTNQGVAGVEVQITGVRPVVA